MTERVAGRQRGAAPTGRTAELDRLAGTLGECLHAGGPGRARITGPAGIGRTTVLRRFATRAESAGARVLSHQCRPGAAPGDALLGLLGADGPVTGQPISAWAIGRIAALAAGQPLVLLVDDAHWCDRSSFETFALLARRVPNRPVLLVLAERPGALPAWRAEVTEPVRVPRSRRPLIELGPLTEDQIAELAGQWWPMPPEPEFLRVCAERTGGCPGVLRELFDQLVAEQYRPDSTAVRRAARLGDELATRVVAGGLGALPPDVREIAVALAVFGRVDEGLLSAFAQVSAGLLTPALTVLRHERVLDSALAGLTSPGLREAILAEVPAGELAVKREQAARLLNYTGAPIREVGEHLFALSSLHDPWMHRALAEAALAAESRGELRLAERYYGRLADLEPSDLGMRAEQARVIGVTDPAEAFTRLRELLGASGPSSEPGAVRLRARIAVYLGRCALGEKKVSEITPLLLEISDRLDAELGDEPVGADRELRALLDSTLLMLGWTEDAVLPRIRRWGVTRGVLDGTPAERELQAIRAVGSMLEGASAEAAAARARAALDGNADIPSSWAFFLAAYVLYLVDELDESRAATDRLVAAADRTGAIWEKAIALCVRAMAASGGGELAGAVADARTAVALTAAGGWEKAGVIPAIVLASVLSRQGTLDDAAAVLGRIDPEEASRSVLREPLYLMVKAQLAIEAGEDEQALATLLECGRALAGRGVANPVFAPWWLEAALLSMRLGRVEQARELVGHGEELAGRWDTNTARGLLLLGRAVLAEGSEEVSLLAAAAELFEAAPWYRTRAEIRLGDALRRGGDHGAARKHYRVAVDLSARCGFEMLAISARERLQAARGRMHRNTGDAADVLTGAERRVAELAAVGATNREISETLLIAQRTVELHLTSVYRKLAVTGRDGLAAVLASR